MWNPKTACLGLLHWQHSWCTVRTDGLHFKVSQHPAYRAFSGGQLTRFRLYLVDNALCPIVLVKLSRADGATQRIFFGVQPDRFSWELVEWEEAIARECAGKNVETFES